MLHLLWVKKQDNTTQHTKLASCIQKSNCQFIEESTIGTENRGMATREKLSKLTPNYNALKSGLFCSM
jgi:hypothetical protein